MQTPKKLHRFLVDHIPSTDTFTLEDERFVHQALQVLKMTPGEQLIVFVNGGADTVCEIIARDKKSITLQKIDERDPLPSSKNIVAAIAIAKGQTFELIVQKLTELGVTTIVPLITSRTVKQAVRMDRLQTISDEALEQSGGNARVTIHEPMTLEQSFKEFTFPVIAFQAGASTTIGSIEAPVTMYIGPEGGWSDQDIAFLDAHNAQWKSLGSHVLRTETAAIVASYELLK